MLKKPKIILISGVIIAFFLASLVLINSFNPGIFGFLKTNSEQLKAIKITLSNPEIVREVKPATVFIETSIGTGSGMIIDQDGHILTNAHVVTGVKTAKVKTSDGQLFSASVVGRDEIIDVAVLKISGEDFPTVKFGDSDTIDQGDDVFTLGYPFGLEGDVSFKEGTISRRISDGDITYLETSAQIHPGNSGGPLVNRYGEVVGVNTAGFGESIEGIQIGETIKLAIPINQIKGLIADLKDGREILVEKKAVKQTSQSTPQPPAPAAPSKPNANTVVAFQIHTQEVGNIISSLFQVEKNLPYVFSGTASQEFLNKMDEIIAIGYKQINLSVPQVSFGNLLVERKILLRKWVDTLLEYTKYLGEAAKYYELGLSPLPSSLIQDTNMTKEKLTQVKNEVIDINEKIIFEGEKYFGL